jgi:hypothetical protein
MFEFREELIPDALAAFAFLAEMKTNLPQVFWECRAQSRHFCSTLCYQPFLQCSINVDCLSMPQISCTGAVTVQAIHSIQ